MADNEFGDGDYKKAYVRPSYSKPRKNLPSHEPIKLQDAPITSQYVPGRKLVTVSPVSPSDSKGDEVIAEEEAVCRFCFCVLKEKKVLKTVCGCKFALIHNESATKWSGGECHVICDYCEQEVHKIIVTLHQQP